MLYSHESSASGAPASNRGAILSRLYTWFATTFPNTRRVLWHAVYEILAALNSRREWTLMNYGYVEDLEDTAEVGSLKESEALCQALYARVIGHRDLSGLDVLEVGSGYGGGARHLATTFGPKSYTGLDFAERAVDLANTEHEGVEGLAFVHGDAMKLPFEADRFDVVVNVESSHCYPSTERFFEQAARVLRPGGLLCWTDIRHGLQHREVDPALELAGFEIIESTDITPHVLAAMDKMSSARLNAVLRYLPDFVSGIGQDFAGTRGSNIHTRLSSGKTRYMLRVGRLPEA